MSEPDDHGTPPIRELRYTVPYITAPDWELLEGVEVDPAALAALQQASTAARDALTVRLEDRHDPNDELRQVLTCTRDLPFPVPWAATRWLEYAALAVLARPYLGFGDWTEEAYETLTYTWRKVIGELHPDDRPLPDDGVCILTGPPVRALHSAGQQGPLVVDLLAGGADAAPVVDVAPADLPNRSYLRPLIGRRRG